MTWPLDGWRSGLQPYIRPLNAVSFCLRIDIEGVLSLIPLLALQHDWLP